MLTSSPSPTPLVPSSYNSSTSFSRSSQGPSHCSPKTFRKSSLPSSPPSSKTRSSTNSAASSHLTRSPKRPTADAGTQYSPQDWPSTSSRSSLRRKQSVPFRDQPLPPQPLPSQPFTSAGALERAPAAANVADDARTGLAPPPEPPREPIVRETPQTSLASARFHAVRTASPAATDSHDTPAAKRAKPSEHPPKALPAAYEQCPPKTLATLIAGLLMDLIQHNDKIQLQDNHLTRFHSRTPPGISVHDYLQRLTFHATLPAPILLSMVFYIDRLCAAFEAFTINSLTVHRFLIAAATVAAKGLMDVFWTNSTYAKVGGVSLKELALLELELLERVEWKIIPSTEKLAEYYRGVVERHPDYFLDETSETSSDELSPDSMDTDSPGQDQSPEASG